MGKASWGGLFQMSLSFSSTWTKTLFEYFNYFTRISRPSKFGLLSCCRTCPLEGIFTKPHLFLVLLCELLLFLISFSHLLNRRIHLCLRVSSETQLHNGKTNLPWDSLCSDPTLEGKRVQIPFLRRLNKNINSIQRAPHNGELGSSLSDSPANPFVDRHPLHSFSTRVHNLLRSELGSFLWK